MFVGMRTRGGLGGAFNLRTGSKDNTTDYVFFCNERISPTTKAVRSWERGGEFLETVLSFSLSAIPEITITV